MLTKSKLMAMDQCSLRLWQQIHASKRATDSGSEAIMRAGTNLGVSARRIFPGGVLIESLDAKKAVASTQMALQDASTDTIFEGAFQAGGLLIRADVLERKEDGWRLIEVKSSTSVKPHYVLDVATQLSVLRANGVAVDSVEVMHVDNSYRRGEGDIDWSSMFKRVDVTQKAEDSIPAVTELLARAEQVAADTAAPKVEPGKQCSKPHKCEFWDYCTRKKPEDWFFPMYHFGRKFEAIKALGIESVGDVPDSLLSGERQRRIRDCHRDGRDWVSSDLEKLISPIGPTPWAFDIEAINPAIPVWPRTVPYQQIPFQWSAHRRRDDGSLEHIEFLADPNQDPRPQFIESVIDKLSSDDAKVIVYSTYEVTAFKTLASSFPDYAKELDLLRGRFVDLAVIVRNGVYNRAFSGSYSIKKVGPALAHNIDYISLEGVSDGLTASSTFEEMVSGNVSDDDRRRLRSELLAYCALDTLALLEVFEQLWRHGTNK